MQIVNKSRQDGLLTPESKMNKQTKRLSKDRHSYSISKLKPEEDVKFEDLLYETFYVPDNMEPLPKEIVSLPYYRQYISDLGSRKGDCCFVAKDSFGGEIVGAVWTRIMNDTMVAENNTPFLLIAVSPEHRRKGIGSALLLCILSELRNDGYTKVLLTVNRQNQAIALYRRNGFMVYCSDDENYLMVNYL